MYMFARIGPLFLLILLFIHATVVLCADKYSDDEFL